MSANAGCGYLWDCDQLGWALLERTREKAKVVLIAFGIISGCGSLSNLALKLAPLKQQCKRDALLMGDQLYAHA